MALKVHELTYDPEAEKFAAAKAAADEAEKAQRDAAAAKQAAVTTAAASEAEAKAAAEKAAAERESRSKFSAKRMAGTVFGTAGAIILWCLLFIGAVLGASLATNLNVHKSWPYRILYGIYGFVFFPVVILYVVGYRWLWKRKQPIFYSLLPLIPYRIDPPLIMYLFSWLSYRPDDTIGALEEWRFVGDDAQPEPVITYEP